MSLPGINTIELQCQLGVTKCTVTSCPNFYETENPDKSELYFLEFPHEDYELCKLWRQRCGVGENYPITDPRICAGHFRMEDFVNYTRKKLKPDAIPRLRLDWMLGAPTVVLCQSNEGKIEVQKQDATLKTIMVLSGKVKRDPDCDTSIPPPDCPPNFEEVKKAVDENEILKKKLSILQSEYFSTKRKAECYEKKLRSVMFELGRISKKNKDKNMKKPTNLISKVFSPAQVNVLLGKKKVVWSYDDMAMAFTLRHMGNKDFYLYLKQTLNMPLPSLSSVQKWIASNKV